MANHPTPLFQPRKRLLPQLWAGFDRYLLPSPCLLCGCQLNTQEGTSLCNHCIRALPYLGQNRCASCSLPLSSSASFCGECLKRRPAFTASAIPFAYQYPLDHLILEFKYRHRLASGRCLGELMLDYLQQGISAGDISQPELLVPVPLHWGRQWQRGFNQAEYMARFLGEHLDIPILNCVQRERQDRSQKDLGRRERQRNLRNRFSLISKLQHAIKGKHIAVVDDVVTTGATARVMSDLLIRAGAKRVDIWALARTPDPT